MIFTCRTQYIREKLNYGDYFRSRQDYLFRIYIAPFSLRKIKDYISLWTQVDSDEVEVSWMPSDYERVLCENPELQELVENPLLLNLVIEAMPKILAGNDIGLRAELKHERVMHLQKFTHAEIYDAFIDSWFRNQVHRLPFKELEIWGMPRCQRKRYF